MNYEEWLEKIANELHENRNLIITLAYKVVQHSLCEEDLYILSILDKCTRLIDGFTDLLRKRNLACVGILLRVQIDNCMRTYALYDAKDASEVYKSIRRKSIELKTIKSKSGKPMTDKYLVEELSKRDEHIYKAYKDACGYVHHSEKSFYSITQASKEPDYSIYMGIGEDLPEDINKTLQQCYFLFRYFIHLQIELTQPFIRSKEKFDKEDMKNLKYKYHIDDLG